MDKKQFFEETRNEKFDILKSGWHSGYKEQVLKLFRSDIENTMSFCLIEKTI